MWCSHQILGGLHQVIMLKFMSQTQFSLWNQEHQDTVHQTVLVEQMKAIANLMTNVYLVLFVDMTTANLNLAIQVEQIVASTKLNIAQNF